MFVDADMRTRSPNTRTTPIARTPGRVNPRVWDAAVGQAGPDRIDRLRRRAGLRFLAGMVADEAVGLGLKDLEGDLWHQEPWQRLADGMGAALTMGDLRQPNGTPPLHVREAAEAVIATVRAINSLPPVGQKDAQGRDTADVAAWTNRVWRTRGVVCSACGGEMEDSGQRGPVLHKECMPMLPDMARAFVRLVVPMVRANPSTEGPSAALEVDWEPGADG